MLDRKRIICYNLLRGFMTLLKRNGKKVDILLENNFLISNEKIGQRDTLLFTCKKCGKNSSRRISLFKDIKNIQDRDLYCQLCNTKENNLEKYGVDNTAKLVSTKNKIKQTNIKKYGGSAPACSNEIKNKIKQTNIKKYGGNAPACSDEIKNKIKQTNIKKYGVEYPISINNISNENKKEKALQKLKNISGFTFLQQDYVGLQNNYDFKCNKCNTIFKKSGEQAILNGIRCPVCTPFGISSYEIKISKFLESLKVDYINNDRKEISPYEIDIYIPNKKLGIEINGLYWHSEEYKNNKYHYNKFDMCNKKGIKLLQFFEDEIIEKEDIVLSKIKIELGIYTEKIFGRKCIIKKVNKKDSNIFLNENHLIGEDNSSVRIGLYYKELLVSLMTFKKVKDGYNLNRFCNKKGTIVIGAFSKLLKNFQRNYKYNFIESFSDNRYSNGEVYNKNGFTFIKDIKPSYWYIFGIKRYHKFNFRKKEILKKFSNKYSLNENMTEDEMMKIVSAKKIYGAGLKKWVMI